MIKTLALLLLGLSAQAIEINRSPIDSTENIADGSVTTPKLADAAVTSAKLANTLTSSMTFTAAVVVVGTLTARGTTGNDNAAAGNIGEVITACGSGTPAPINGGPVSIATMTLTPGDWDVSGNASWNAGATTSATAFIWCLTLNESACDGQTLAGYQSDYRTFAVNGVWYNTTGTRRINTSISRSVFLVAQINLTVVGGAVLRNDVSCIYARRAR